MRSINLDDYYKKNMAAFAKKRLELLVDKEKRVKRRPRNPEEQEALFILTSERRKRWLKEGKMKISGPRSYILS